MHFRFSSVNQIQTKRNIKKQKHFKHFDPCRTKSVSSNDMNLSEIQPADGSHENIVNDVPVIPIAHPHIP